MTDGFNILDTIREVLAMEMSDEDVARSYLMQPHMASTITGEITTDEALRLADMEWDMLTAEERADVVRKSQAMQTQVKKLFGEITNGN